jgi:hypothetical protein
VAGADDEARSVVAGIGDPPGPLKENPARARLVDRCDEWPWQGEIEPLMLYIGCSRTTLRLLSPPFPTGIIDPGYNRSPGA